MQPAPKCSPSTLLLKGMRCSTPTTEPTSKLIIHISRSSIAISQNHHSQVRHHIRGLPPSYYKCTATLLSLFISLSSAFNPSLPPDAHNQLTSPHQVGSVPTPPPLLLHSCPAPHRLTSICADRVHGTPRHATPQQHISTTCHTCFSTTIDSHFTKPHQTRPTTHNPQLTHTHTQRY